MEGLGRSHDEQRRRRCRNREVIQRRPLSAALRAIDADRCLSGAPARPSTSRHALAAAERSTRGAVPNGRVVGLRRSTRALALYQLCVHSSTPACSAPRRGQDFRCQSLARCAARDESPEDLIASGYSALTDVPNGSRPSTLSPGRRGGVRHDFDPQSRPAHAACGSFQRQSSGRTMKASSHCREITAQRAREMQLRSTSWDMSPNTIALPRSHARVAPVTDSRFSDIRAHQSAAPAAARPWPSRGRDPSAPISRHRVGLETPFALTSTKHRATSTLRVELERVEGPAAVRRGGVVIPRAAASAAA